MEELRFSGAGDTNIGQGSPTARHPLGFTVEQIWRGQLNGFGLNTICLISSAQPRVSTTAIDHVVFLSSLDTVKVARQVLAPNRVGDARAIQACYYDGSIAHCIVLRDWDSDKQSFIFIDSWPGESLLCAHQNKAGLDAEFVADHLWSIPGDQLEPVLVALLVLPLAWADATGAPGAITYDAIRSSDFWNWFHVKEVEHVGRSVKLCVPSYPNDCRLDVELDSRGRVITARLRLRRSFVFGPPYGLNPFAMDIAKSFIIPFAPRADHGWLSEANQMLTKATLAALSESSATNEDATKTALEAAFNGSDRSASAASSIMRAFYSPETEAHVSLDLGALDVSTTEGDDGQWTVMRCILR